MGRKPPSRKGGYRTVKNRTVRIVAKRQEFKGNDLHRSKGENGMDDDLIQAAKAVLFAGGEKAMGGGSSLIQEIVNVTKDEKSRAFWSKAVRVLGEGIVCEELAWIPTAAPRLTPPTSESLLSSSAA